MLLKSSSVRVLGLVLVIAAITGVMQSQQTNHNASVLNSQADENTAIRFFYNPPGHYFHVPLILRGVEQTDPRLNTAPLGDEGRTAYVSLVEMQQLLRGLLDAKLSWEESERTQALGPFKRIPLSGSMDILVVCSKGTARAKVGPNRICKTLKPLESALRTPRALWECQGFRLNYGCKVPGFNYDAYPDRQ